MKKISRYFLVFGVLTISIAVNCYMYYYVYKQSVNIFFLEKENHKLSILNNQYANKLRIDKEVYELRNILDIDARRFINAMVNKDLETIKKYTAGNIRVYDNELVITLPQFRDKYTYQYPARVGELRQRHYSLDENKRFITGYEASDESKTNSIWIIELTFIREGKDWKIQMVGNDI